MQQFICGFSISKNNVSNIQKKKRFSRVISRVHGLFMRENLFFFEFFCPREIIFFWTSKTTNEELHLP